MNLKRAYAVSRKGRNSFTLVEMLVATAVLGMILVILGQLFSAATVLTRLGGNHLDTDEQARAVFDRMATDFSQMLRRKDVDYFFKDSTTLQTGNDQFAFYCQVPGYYPAATAQSPVSLVAYRVNTSPGASNPNINRLQRLGYGLVWNGVPVGTGTGVNTNAYTPVFFSTNSTTVLPNTLSANWPTAANMTPAAYPDATYEDSNYELAGAQVFRLEYYYVLKGQTLPAPSTLPDGTTLTTGVLPSQLSSIPWDSRIAGISGVADHTSVNGMQDVAAITVVIAVISPTSQRLVSSAQLTALAANMADFPATTSTGDNTTAPGYLEANWQTAINNPASTTPAIPRVAAAGIQVYRHCFYLSTTPISNP